MNVYSYLLQKYMPTQKHHVWAVALLYMLPVSLLAADADMQMGTFIKRDAITIMLSQAKKIKANYKDTYIKKGQLKSKFAKEKIQGKSMEIDAFINELKKKDAAIAITEAASTLLTQRGYLFVTRAGLDALILLGLVQAEKFNLDGLTLDALTHSLNFGNEDDEDDGVIIGILEKNKEKFLEKVISELESNNDSWQELNSLLLRKKQKGIPKLDLSYEKINLPSKLLIDKITSALICAKIVEKIVRKTKKGATFINDAFKEIEKLNDNDEAKEKKIWYFLHYVVNYSKDEKAIEALGKFTAEIYAAIKSKEAFESALAIVEVISKKKEALTKEFVIDAFKLLQNEKETERIKNIWEAVSRLPYNYVIEDIPQLEDYIYHQFNIVWESNKPLTMFKNYLKNNQKAALKIAQKAFEGDNQKQPHFWDLLNLLLLDEKAGIKISAQEINIQGITLETAVEGAQQKQKVLKEILVEREGVVHRLWEQALKGDLRKNSHLLHFILDNYMGNYNIDTLTVDKVIEESKYYNSKVLLKKIFNKFPARAKVIGNELYTKSKSNQSADAYEALEYFRDVIKLGDIEVKEFDVKSVAQALKNKGSSQNFVMNSIIQSKPEKAKKLVEDILNGQDKLDREKMNILDSLIKDQQLGTSTNKQDAPVSSQDISIPRDSVLKICKEIAGWKLDLDTTHFMLGIVKSIIEQAPNLGEYVLQIAVNGKEGGNLNWSNDNINFGVLHLLMVHEKGPQMTVKDVETLNLTAIKKHLKKEKAFTVIKKILNKNKSANKSFYWEIFSPKDISMRDKPFNYKNVDWDNTKWNDIKGLESLIGPIPADIVIEKLKVGDEKFLNFFKEISSYYDEKQGENLLKKAFPNIAVTDGKWNEALSEVNWDIVKLFVDKGVIEPESVIEEVLPGITFSDKKSKNIYNFTKVNWEKFDEKAFPDLVKYKIAEFSIEDYQTIAKKVLPGLAFTNEGVQASKIDWERVKGFATINFLLEEKAIPENILVEMPDLIQKKLTTNAPAGSTQEAFLEKVKEKKSIYRRNAALWLGTFVLGCIIAFYALRKKENRKSTQAKNPKNRKAIKKMSKSKLKYKRRKEISKKLSPSHRKGAMPQRKKN